jgi:hypothetical protein
VQSRPTEANVPRDSVTPQKRGHCDASIKRLEIGSFQLPAAPGDPVSIEMTPTQLALILSGIDLRSARQRKRYQRPTPEAEKTIGAPL